MSTEAGKQAGHFPTTHWSEVARAGDIDPQIKREALGRLLGTYAPALKAHLIYYNRVKQDQADDLLQGFICDQVVADDLISRADQQRGRFRAFVVTALSCYVARVARSEHAQKRHPGTPLLSLDVHEPGVNGNGAPADLFDVAWARELVRRAIRHMRRKCEAGGKDQLWLIFKSCCLAPLLEGAAAPSHQQLMRQLGLSSTQEVSNTLVTAKRMFARVLRGIVGEYACGDDEVEAELRDLWTILSQAGAGGDVAASLKSGDDLSPV
jgi:RNA polymerase sigma-70 factor (ECF subfamily)